MARRSRRRRLLALLVLLLLLLLWPLNSFLGGVFPGGGRLRDDPEPALRRGAVEVLVFRREDREPVRGATVSLAGLHGTKHTRKTGGDGRAEFAGLPAAPVRLEAGGRGGFATAWSKPGERVEMALAPRRVRRGRVRTEDDRPVEAEVFLLDKDARVLASGRTGADGRYELEDDPRAAAVCAWPERGAPSAAAAGDVVVGDGVRHEGKALDPGRGSVEVFALVPDSKDDRMVPLRVCWELDSEGRYAGLLPAGAEAFLFHGPCAVPLGEDRAIAMAGLPKGRVVDAAGKPVAGARVAARAMANGMPVSPNPFPIERMTDRQGRFDLGRGPDARYELELWAPGFARTVVPAPRDGEPIVLTRGFRIGGRVVDADGEPVAGARIDALPTPDPDAKFLKARTATTDDGKFWVDGLGGDYARVRVHAEGYRGARMDRVPPQGFVTIRLVRE